MMQEGKEAYVCIKMLNSFHIRIHRLTWHNGIITPPNEIRVKVGGDKGGGTFKFCFQLLNVEVPNSPENTCVISMFEGPDSFTNLHICLDQYIEQLAEMNLITWRCSHISYLKQLFLFFRGKKIKVFLCGDYEFLCRCHGASGVVMMYLIIASFTHPFQVVTAACID